MAWITALFRLKEHVELGYFLSIFLPAQDSFFGYDYAKKFSKLFGDVGNVDEAWWSL